MKIFLVRSFLVFTVALVLNCYRKSVSTSVAPEKNKESVYEKGWIVEEVEGGVSIKRHTNPVGDLTLPETIKGKKVVEISDNAFKSNSRMTGLNILATGLTSLGVSAFEDCSSLVNINLPDGLTYINTRVFFGCRSLQKIVLPKNIEVIGEESFWACSSLKEILFSGNKVTTIGDKAFIKCESLENVNFPSSLKKIGSLSFSSCLSLKRITLPENLESMEDCFYNCSALTEIILLKTSEPYIRASNSFTGTPIETGSQNATIKCPTQELVNAYKKVWLNQVSANIKWEVNTTP